MSDLLELVQEAHGGLEQWKQVRGLTVVLTLGGYLFEIKGYPDGLRSSHVFLDAQKPGTVIWPFPHRGSRGTFTAGKVRLQKDDGTKGDELLSPRNTYEGHVRTTPWTELQYLYFIGYAFWNYFTTPFLFSQQGVSWTEGPEHEEHGQIWRTMDVTFPPEIDTHCKTQRFYFDQLGHQRRHDYFTDVARGNGAHYTYDERVFDGFLFPTRRRVVTRAADQSTQLSGPSSVWIEVESVFVHKGYL